MSAMQRSGVGAARTEVDIRSSSLLTLVCLGTENCWLQFQLWILNRLEEKPLEVGRHTRRLLQGWRIGHGRIAAML